MRFLILIIGFLYLSATAALVSLQTYQLITHLFNTDNETIKISQQVFNKIDNVIETNKEHSVVFINKMSKKYFSESLK